MRQKQKRKLALFDIDKTVYDGYLLFPLIEQQRNESTISEKTYAAIQEIYVSYKKNDIDYETFARLLLIEWASGLKGIPTDLVLKQAIQLVDREVVKFYPYVASVMKLFWPSHDIYLVTGEPQFVAQPVKTLFNADGIVSTDFETTSTKTFSGKVERFLATKAEKLSALNPLLSTHDLSDSYAFGDSAGDIEMLNLVEHPVCVNPSEELRSLAVERNWEIVTPDTILPNLKKRFQNS